MKFRRVSVNDLNIPTNMHLDNTTGWYVCDGINGMAIPELNGERFINKYYCFKCNRYLYFGNSTSNIIRHMRIHNPDLRKEYQNKLMKKYLGTTPEVTFNEKQQDFISKKIISFFILHNLPFQDIESLELKEITSKLPSREQISEIVRGTGPFIKKEISAIFQKTSAVYISFDEWTDSMCRSYLGISSRVLIDDKYSDFVISFLPITKSSNADNIADMIYNEIISYNIPSVTSCVSDNCNLMNAVGNLMPFKKFPCVCHILNLIMKTFITNANNVLKPIFNMLQKIECSTLYEKFVISKKCKKVSSYCQTRWCSFCSTVIDIKQTMAELREFHGKEFDESIEVLTNSLIPLVESFQSIVKFYESDEFGATGFFLAHIKDINELFTELATKNPEFEPATKAAISKIKELSNKHKDFWEFCYEAVLLNPVIDPTKLFEPKELGLKTKLLQSRINRRFPPKRQFSESQNSTFITGLEKYQKNKSDEVILTVEKVRTIYLEYDQLQHFWFNNIGTVNNGIAIYAIEILGTLITSCSTEREFSGTRRIFGDLRLNLSPETAESQILISANKEISHKIINEKVNLMNS